jgi:hypothetical protein
VLFLSWCAGVEMCEAFARNEKCVVQSLDNTEDTHLEKARTKRSAVAVLQKVTTWEIASTYSAQQTKDYKRSQIHLPYTTKLVKSTCMINIGN